MMDMSKGYKALLLVFALALLTGCGVRFAPMLPAFESDFPREVYWRDGIPELI